MKSGCGRRHSAALPRWRTLRRVMKSIPQRHKFDTCLPGKSTSSSAMRVCVPTSWLPGQGTFAMSISPAVHSRGRRRACSSCVIQPRKLHKSQEGLRTWSRSDALGILEESTTWEQAGSAGRREHSQPTLKIRVSVVRFRPGHQSFSATSNQTEITTAAAGWRHERCTFISEGWSKRASSRVSLTNERSPWRGDVRRDSGSHQQGQAGGRENRCCAQHHEHRMFAPRP